MNYFENNGIAYFESIEKLATYLFKLDKNFTISYWLDKLSYLNSNFIVMIDNDINNIQTFNSYDEARQYMIQVFLVRNECLHKGSAFIG